MKTTLQSLTKVLISFLAVVFLAVSTACNSAEVGAVTPDEPQAASGNKQAGQITELYKPISPAKGGMNTFSDIDPRRDDSKAAAKADRNISQANSNQKGNVNPIQEVKKELNKKGPQERANELSSNVGRAVKERAEETSEGAKKGVRNIQDNTKSLAKDAGNVADNLGGKADRTASDVKSAVQNTADSVANKVSKTADSVANKVGKG